MKKLLVLVPLLLLMAVACTACLESDYQKLPANVRNYRESVDHILYESGSLETVTLTNQLGDGLTKYPDPKLANEFKGNPEYESEYVFSVIDEALPLYQKHEKQLDLAANRSSKLNVPKGFEESANKWQEVYKERIAAAKAMADSFTYANAHPSEAGDAFRKALLEFADHWKKAANLDDEAIHAFGKEAYKQP